MELSKEKLLEIISKGESQIVEFKEKIPNSTILVRVLSSFANTEGGLLLLGVSDSGEIVGLSKEELDFSLNLLKQIVNSLFESDIPISTITIDDKEVIIVSVPKNKEGSLPVITAAGEMYIRDRQNTRAAIASVMSRNLSHNIGSHVLGSVNFQKRKAAIKDKIKIFVAMSFREEEEPALVDYYRAMEKAVENTNLPISIYRVDRVEGDYEISQQIMDEIDNSDIVIADFTFSSQNVYFELGYARAKGRRIIQTARKDTRLEFDTRNWKTIIYRNATELETKLEPAIRAAYEQLTKT